MLLQVFSFLLNVAQNLLRSYHDLSRNNCQVIYKAFKAEHGKYDHAIFVNVFHALFQWA